MSKKKPVTTPDDSPTEPAVIHPVVVILKDVGDFKSGMVVQTKTAADLIKAGDARAATSIDAATAGVSFPAAAFEAAANLPVPTPATKKET